MPSLTTTYDRIIRQPALTMPGNATGSEAACTALTGSQIRAICGLGTTDNVTHNILTATTSVLTPLVNNASAALTLGNATYGVTVPGNAVCNGDISMSKTSAQGYVYAYSTGGVRNTRFYHDNSNGWVEASYGDLVLNSADGDVYAFKSGTNSTIGAYNSNGSRSVLLNPTTVPSVVGNTDLYAIATSGAVVLQGSAGSVQVFKSGSNCTVDVYDSGVTKYTRLTHDGTNGILSTSSGNLNLVPTGGTVAVTGAVTATTTVTANSFAVSNLTLPYTSVNHWNSLYLDRVVSGFGLVREADIQTYRNNNGTFGTDHRVYGTSSTYDSSGTKYIRCAHNGTHAIISSFGGNINLEPNLGTVVVTGGITASGAIQETYRTSSLDPTVSDIGSGKRQGWYNTTATEFRDWVNVGGTLYKSAAYT